jgi:cell division protease FtsH
LLRDGKIAEVQVSDRFIQGRFTEPQNGRPMFVTTRVEPDLAQQLQHYSVVVTGQIESTFLRDLLSWAIPLALFVGVWMLMIRRMGGGLGGGLMQISKSKVKVYGHARLNLGCRQRGSSGEAPFACRLG